MNDDLEKGVNQLSNKININPENAADDLVKLVLSLVNTIREVMEKQALRKIMKDQLNETEVEKLGATFLALEEKMNELKNHFNLSDEDLDIDLKKLLKS